MSTDPRGSWILSGTTAAFVAALYVPCVQRTVPGGDSGELITTACELGVAHPPGYPVFTLLARLAMCLLPSLSPAHSVNLMSSLLGAAACGTLCLTVCRLEGPGPGAVLAGGLFAVSRLSWQWSMVAEVFALNNLFVGLLLFLTASFHCAENAAQRRKIAHVGALCCGLGLCNQHTLVLYVLLIIPWVLHRLYARRELNLHSLVSLGACFFWGFLPYIYLPVSSYLNTARWSWGDQTTLSGLLTHLLRAEYGTFSLAKTESPINMTLMLKAQLNHCVEDLSLPALVLAGIGFLLSSSDRECDQSTNGVVERFGRELLASVPTDSIILTRGDLPGNSMRYLYYCQGVRPDVRLVDQEMMTYAWYVAKHARHHPGVHFPGRLWHPVHPEGSDTFSLEQFLSYNTQRHVFACIGLSEGDSSWERSFYLWPMGVCDYLVPTQRQFHPERWAQRTRNIYNWSEPHNSFHPASWERVANEEMWQARMKTAFFLFDLAERMQGEGKARLSELSYTLYKEIVEAHSDYPPNWDKNLALACERLLRSGQRGHGVDGLLTCSARHFSLYLQKEPTDPQAAAIRAATADLLKERDKLRQSGRRTTGSLADVQGAAEQV
ncbi:protein O-mannosyl-transferase TMEM260 isoform 5-T6 [Spinachia spinachia]